MALRNGIYMLIHKITFQNENERENASDDGYPILIVQFLVNIMFQWKRLDKKKQLFSNSYVFKLKTLFLLDCM